jgi:phage shock protein PspC (stress-responsive transcriptional regulator)
MSVGVQFDIRPTLIGVILIAAAVAWAVLQLFAAFIRTQDREK